MTTCRSRVGLLACWNESYPLDLKSSYNVTHKTLVCWLNITKGVRNRVLYAIEWYVTHMLSQKHFGGTVANPRHEIIFGEHSNPNPRLWASIYKYIYKCVTWLNSKETSRRIPHFNKALVRKRAWSYIRSLNKLRRTVH